MFGYAPSLIVTAILSLASLSFLTSLLSHAEYGQYALAINMMTMLLGVCFFWLQNATTRLMPQAVIEGSEARLSATLYYAFALTGIILLVVFGAIAALTPLGDWRIAILFAPLLAVLRALLNLNQAFHRNFVRIARYNIIEIGQAVIGLAAAIILIKLIHRGASEAATGMVIGFAMMSVFDWRMLGAASWKNFDAGIFKEIVHFGLPFIANFAFSFILAGSDRFLIEFFLGPDQVGLYSAGYAFPDRIGQYLFMAVATASFPLIVRRLEQEGTEPARDQTYINGVAMLALAIPACIGMLMADRQIAAVLIGADFRASAVKIIPWIAVATMFNGFAAHYFDHAFLLAKKTRFFFLTLGPAALLNFIGNLYAIPHFGIIGAAYTTLAAYALYLVLSITFGRRVFRIKFPFGPALRIALAAAFMALVLSTHSFPQTLPGLIEIVICGGTVYMLGLLVFNVMDMRGMIKKQWARPVTPVSATGALRFEILTSPAQIAALAADWRKLYAHMPNALFGSYEWFQIWERHLGQSLPNSLHIVTARHATGNLAALLPLVVKRSGFLRVAEWAGYEVFDYGDVLALSAADAQTLWAFVAAQKFYDIALFKDVYVHTLSLPILMQNMRLRAQRLNYFLTLDFPSGDTWLAAQSRKLRGDTRRKREKLQAHGAVDFHIYQKGTPFPDTVIDALYEQKTAWFKARKASGVFSRPEIRAFLHELAHDAARQGNLYLAWLACDDKIIACHMGFVRGGILYLYHTTYDAAYGAYSPGNILMTETIKAAIDAGLKELDFMRGDEAYKQRFAGGTRFLSAFVLGRTRIGKIAIYLRGKIGKKTLPPENTNEET
jgi:CelD/BcsL family acetyltransferase involved in cellulose biosynthesis/O-antigen/teichoic acid export membrane protein